MEQVSKKQFKYFRIKVVLSESGLLANTGLLTHTWDLVPAVCDKMLDRVMV